MSTLSTSFASAVAGLILAAASAPLAAQGPAPQPLSETERIVHLLQRFAFGPTPAAIDEVRAVGIDAWMEARLAPTFQESGKLTALLARFETLDLDCAALAARMREQPRGDTPKARAELNQRRNQPARELRQAVLLRAVYANNQLQETVADFFRNHFNICLEKDQIRTIATDWERTALRANLFGDFHTLLSATAKHPAMLLYLDNHLSRRPPSEQELREIERNTRRRTGSRERGEEAAEIARQRGLNENYARELLELHTLGVDNYYTQRDVIEVAKVLTGWTVGLRGGSGGFAFRADMHCTGDKTVLGRTIEADRKAPLAEGEAVLRLLADHPGTARFLAWKLCRHFVTDAPSDALVERIAKAFRKADGDLPTVYRALVADPEFFARANYASKFKRPFEFLVSALRVTEAQIENAGPRGESLARYFGELCEPLYACDDPTGYYDHADAWCDPGAMAVRWRFATDLAEDRIRGVRMDAAAVFADLDPAVPTGWIEPLVARITPGGIGRTTRAALEKVVLAHQPGDRRADPRRLWRGLVAILLGSPEFQRQ